jgi:hypothetical protein
MSDDKNQQMISWFSLPEGLNFSNLAFKCRCPLGLWILFKG